MKDRTVSLSKYKEVLISDTGMIITVLNLEGRVTDQISLNLEESKKLFAELLFPQ